MSYPEEAYIECQDCGKRLNYGQPLTKQQKEAVAAKPYDFVVFCTQCRADRIREGTWIQV